MDEKSYNFALNYLARRPRSEKEVRDYLLKKLVSNEKVVVIIARLKELQFLNDEEFVRWWIRQRTEVKPKGKRLISLELRTKGISADLVERICTDAGTFGSAIVSDKDKAVGLLVKRKSKYGGLGRQELYQKAGSFLARRGFDWDVIRRSIDEVFAT